MNVNFEWFLIENGLRTLEVKNNYVFFILIQIIQDPTKENHDNTNFDQNPL